MKSSTLMAIILIAQAVLIMGVFAAAASIENSAGLGEKELTMEPVINPRPLKCCGAGDIDCIPAPSPPAKPNLRTCRYEGKSGWCGSSGCEICSGAKNYTGTRKCLDVFNGTCGPKC
ncbi:hypothetical protein PVAP13_8KG062700 [Panicum virgatum]|uniref:Uncharacterized protein n=2 Tax=Panicum virgatum TaxID=38727 RepID=A0A8T0PN06_PANVG|nr:hypothetical protein PVAP13_8KG062700 [Panicum virgatum]